MSKTKTKKLKCNECGTKNRFEGKVSKVIMSRIESKCLQAYYSFFTTFSGSTCSKTKVSYETNMFHKFKVYSRQVTNGDACKCGVFQYHRPRIFQ